MKSSMIPLVAVFVFVDLLGSCQKNIPASGSNQAPASLSQAFDEFWNEMNTNYVYWDIDTTNWDAAYTRYMPLFAPLDLQKDSDLQKSVGYFRQMTGGLIDSHFSISFIPATIADSFVFPALDRKIQSSSFHSPFLYMGIDSNFFDKGYSYGNYITSNNEQVTAYCATIGHKVLYFNCNRFGLAEAYQSATDNTVKTTLQYFFSQLQSPSSSISGMIIDVRNNQGGDLEDLDFLIGRLIDQSLHFGYTRAKSGNGRLAYTPWVDANISPVPNVKAFTLPIIVLADNYSASLAEAVTMAIHTLPNGRFVGESTWGATGPIADNVLYDDGQFSLPGFLSVVTSSAEFRYLDWKSYEGMGFPPDVAVPFDINALQSGDDPQLDKALSLIN